MGGGPRTFPGGLNKWQWKRLHEKKAKEKEQRLLDQEKQFFQARMRFRIRSSLAGQSHPNLNQDPDKHNPMSPKEYLKALADRFMKDGAEDLWSENDGSLKPPSDEQTAFVGTNQQPGPVNSLVDLRKLISEGRKVSQNRNSGFNYVKSRDYSTLRDLDFGSSGDFAKPSARRQTKFRRNESSSSVDDEGHGFVNDKVKNFVGNSWDERGGVSNLRNVSDFMMNRGSETVKQRRFRRNESDDDDDLEGGGDRRGRSAKDIGSRAALGEYDMKKTRRVPLKELEKNDFANEVELIRYELGRKKKFAGNGGNMEEEDSILSEKR